MKIIPIIRFVLFRFPHFVANDTGVYLCHNWLIFNYLSLGMTDRFLRAAFRFPHCVANDTGVYLCHN